MSVFTKRDTPVQNITYMALMASINVIFVLLTYFVPFLLFMLVFILPLSSTIVATYCKKRYYPIYAIVTIGICMLVTMSNFADTIYFVVPSIVTGFLFGLSIQNKIPSIIVISGITIVQILLTYPGLWLANTILYPDKADVFIDIANKVGISDGIVQYFKHMVIALIAFIQIIISFIVIKEESGKLGLETKENIILEKYVPIGAILTFSLLSWIFAYVYPEICYVFMLGSTLFTIYLIYQIIEQKNKLVLLASAGSLLISIFVFAGFYQSIPEPLGFLPLQIFFCLVGIIVFINNCLLTRKKKI